MKKYAALYVFLVALVFGFASPSSAQHCVVQKGDSMWKIAKKYNVSFEDVLNLNKHFKNQHLIHPQDKVELPDGSTGTETTTASDDDEIATGNQTAPAHGVSDMAHAVLLLVNNERSKQGLKDLTLADDLTNIATTKSKDMAVNGYFSHNSPTYGSPFDMLQLYGIKYKSSGENIAKGQLTANDVMNAWMSSSGHRANILNKSYTEIGVGYYVDSNNAPLWTQLFVRR